MTKFKAVLSSLAVMALIGTAPAMAQNGPVSKADQKNLDAQRYRIATKGNTAAVKRANADDRREIAKRNSAAKADTRANDRDARAQQWRLTHKGDTPAVKRANAKDQASIDYRKTH